MQLKQAQKKQAQKKLAQLSQAQKKLAQMSQAQKKLAQMSQAQKARAYTPRAEKASSQIASSQIAKIVNAVKTTLTTFALEIPALILILKYLIHQIMFDRKF